MQATFEYDELVDLLLKDVGRVLLHIYQLYFPHELKVGVQTDAVIKRESQKSMFNFLKDFDICPGLLTKKAAFRLFSEDTRDVALYTSTGLDILTKTMNKESKAAQLLQFQKLPCQIGTHHTFFRFLDTIVECSVQAFSDPFFLKDRL